MMPLADTGSVRTIGLKLTLTSLSAEVLRPEKIEQRRIAADRRLVEVAADGDPALAGDLTDVLDDAIERALSAAAADASGCACP